MITLTVTKDDINAGVPCVSYACAVAHALKRQGYVEVHATINNVAYRKAGWKTWGVSKTPRHLANWIRRYDLGENMEEIEAVLE